MNQWAKKGISAVHISSIHVHVEIETQKVRWNCFFAKTSHESDCDCMICRQAMRFALFVHMMRKDAHGKGEGTGGSEGRQAGEK